MLVPKAERREVFTGSVEGTELVRWSEEGQFKRYRMVIPL